MSPKTRADVVEEMKEPRTEKEKKRKSESEKKKLVCQSQRRFRCLVGGFQSPCATSRGFDDERVLVGCSQQESRRSSAQLGKLFGTLEPSVGRWKVSGLGGIQWTVRAMTTGLVPAPKAAPRLGSTAACAGERTTADVHCTYLSINVYALYLLTHAPIPLS
ncbi:uncharacterized protein Triagg1_7648 [Trichoderma aggressivum f. europaeum]|uniref:Uncharacterized protein n=1 Tax=Trichoderma aggressivum f. europaeum TaxID=173218 RepID=A0AAE1I9I5_9HYPO|nr:hypothetical protein Triagg1_7648 [Trichoderma aggressivum f. europaeum]